MAGKRPVSAEQKLLDAISTLKRATGIPNSPAVPDAFYKPIPGYLEVFTTDYDSGVILANLISSSMLKGLGHTERFWSKNDRSDFHDEVKVQPHGDNCFRIIVHIPPSRIPTLAKNLSERAQALIAPDKNGKSR